MARFFVAPAALPPPFLRMTTLSDRLLGAQLEPLALWAAGDAVNGRPDRFSKPVRSFQSRAGEQDSEVGTPLVGAQRWGDREGRPYQVNGRSGLRIYSLGSRSGPPGAVSVRPSRSMGLDMGLMDPAKTASIVTKHMKII
jgi:hypothetical protein